MVVKLKISKICIPIQLGIQLSHFLGGGGGGGLSHYSPQYWPILHKFSPEVVFKQRKLMFE